MAECNHECSYEADRRIREREVTLQAEDGTMKGHKPRNAGSDMNFISVQFSCVQLCHPMNCSTPGLPVHQQLLESTQTHVHRVGDAIQPAISSSVIPFSSCPQSFPASGSFPMSQLFASGGQSIGVPASTSVLPVNTQD